MILLFNNYLNLTANTFIICGAMLHLLRDIASGWRTKMMSIIDDGDTLVQFLEKYNYWNVAALLLTTPPMLLLLSLLLFISLSNKTVNALLLSSYPTTHPCFIVWFSFSISGTRTNYPIVKLFFKLGAWIDIGDDVVTLL